MPLLFLVFGILLVVTGIKNTSADMFRLLGNEFTGRDGKPSFVPWLIAIFAVGSIGFVDKLKPIANAFLLLIMVVLVLVNRGFFSEFSTAFKLAEGGKGVGLSGSEGTDVLSDGIDNLFQGSALTGKIPGFDTFSGIFGDAGKITDVWGSVTGDKWGIDKGFDNIGSSVKKIGSVLNNFF
jgi:hypothetical protein